MCKLTKLQHNIHNITKDGYDIAAFLADTMRGETPGVKVCHRMEAAKHLIRYGFTDTDCETTSDRLSRAGGNPEAQGEGTNTPSPVKGEGWDGGEDSPSSLSAPVTHIDILNYEHRPPHTPRDRRRPHPRRVSHSHHDRQGQAIHTRRSSASSPQTAWQQQENSCAVASETLAHATGSQTPPTKSNAYDTLHTDLAKRMREYSERGADTIRFLFEVMSDPNPEEEFTIHHRMSAAQELLRRGWDTNYDNIKPKHLQDYWRDEGKHASVHRPEEDPGRPLNLHRRLQQLRRHRLRSHSQRDKRRRRPRRQFKASSFPSDRPIFSPFLRKQESRRPPIR